MTITDASPLHQALYTAIAAKDADAFNNLVHDHYAEIMADFGAWMVVPAVIRSDQNAVAQYVQSLVAIAQTFAAAGEPRLLERLVGSKATNPIVQWQRRLSHTQALSEAGEYAASNSQLTEILAEMEGATGPAVENLRPMVLGRLGFNALHEQNYGAALAYTAQAYDACLTAADEEGRVTYYENLMALRLIQMLDGEPERGQRLLAARRLVTRAQDAADGGRYQASNNLLTQALSLTQSQNDPDLFSSLLPKIYGLLGCNEYKLGNIANAREQSARALQEAENVGDMDGVRIYTANLTTINSQHPPTAAAPEEV